MRKRVNESCNFILSSVMTEEKLSLERGNQSREVASASLKSHFYEYNMAQTLHDRHP